MKAAGLGVWLGWGLSGHTHIMKKEKLMPLLGGLITGVCNGLLGAGGGMVAVLALKRLCRLPEKEAHATAIGVMLPLTALSSLLYVLGGAVAWDVLAFVAPALTVGSLLGAKLTGKLADKALRRLFAALMMAAGAWMLL